MTITFSLERDGHEMVLERMKRSAKGNAHGLEEERSRRVRLKSWYMKLPKIKNEDTLPGLSRLYDPLSCLILYFGCMTFDNVTSASSKQERGEKLATGSVWVGFQSTLFTTMGHGN